MIKDHTHARKRSFVENGVTARHFVTPIPACDQKCSKPPEFVAPPVVTIERHYDADAVDLDALVEVLYTLVIGDDNDGPTNGPSASRVRRTPTCFSPAHE